MSTSTENGRTAAATTAATRLRHTCAAVRLSFNWLGTRKSLTVQQQAQAADTFGAERQYLSAGKKLIDTRHPSFRAVTAVRGRIQAYWRAMTLPFPEPGIRLIRQDRIESFETHMQDLRQQLDEAVERLEQHYHELQSAARQRLGTLYNPADYPSALGGMFGVAWDFPSVEPPDYLRQLQPELYQRECHRVAARFDAAVRLAEEAFLTELSQLVEHLTERLNGQHDGRPMVFRDSAVNNLTEFFQRFRRLNVRSNQQLDELVDQCQAIVRGVAPQNLRDQPDLRSHVAGELAQLRSSLEELLVERPRRNILRRPR